MSEIKPAPISKSLLTQLPPPVEPPKAEKAPQLEKALQEMKQQIEQLQKTVTFLASFESKLLDAFNSEIDILKEGASLTQNDLQKRAFRSTADSLERIRDRWVDGFSFHVDRKKMSFVRKNPSNE